MIGSFERGRPKLPRSMVVVGLATCLALYGCASTAARMGADRARAATAPYADPRAILADIEYLASDRLEGRGTGTAGNDSAAAHIARRFASLGLRRLDSSYEQHFVARPLAAHNESPRSLPTQNVFALLPGADPALRGQLVVVGAHFDHLGRSTEGALDHDRKNVIRRGADDNASGTAAVLELARLFAASPTKRSLLFVTFSGEELGLLGSEYFVTHSPLPLDSAVAMVNFDMVGRLRDDKLIVYGVATATELPALVDSANVAASAPRAGPPWEACLLYT
jgi:acetylornithine deacetylase/succinyl-diaminopimelate desuccinylase-like protein